MYLNNKNIQGIFLYNEEMPYTAGDLVVYGSTLYVCTAGEPTDPILLTVTGSLRNSKTPEIDLSNYSVYLGNRIATAADYFKCIEGTDTEDKYISSHALSDILNNYYMTGFSSIGQIDGSTASADTYLTNEDFPNSYFTMSRTAAKSIIGEPELLNSDIDLILRQFTFTSSVSGTKYVVQELIDPVTALVAYRFHNFSTKETSTWRFSNIDTAYTGSPKAYIDYVHSYYEKLLAELTIQKENLKNNFCFRNCNFTQGNNVTIQCIDSKESGYISLSEDSSFTNTSCVLTIIYQYLYSGVKYKSGSIDIDLSRFSSGISNFYISDTLTLIVSNLTESTATITISGGDGTICNIYYREYYGNE